MRLGGAEEKRTKFDQRVQKAESILEDLERRFSGRLLGLDIGGRDEVWAKELTAELLPYSLWFLLHTETGQAILLALTIWQAYVFCSGAVNLVLRLLGLLKNRPESNITCVGCLSQVCYESDLALNPLSLTRRKHEQCASYYFSSNQETLEQIRGLTADSLSQKEEIGRITRVLVAQETRYLTRHGLTSLDIEEDLERIPSKCAGSWDVGGERSPLFS